MRDIHGISGVRRTTTTLRRSAHGPREHSGHLGVDPCSFPSFRAMKSASSRSSMPLVSAPGPDRPKGTKALGRVRPGRATYSLDPVLRAGSCEVRGRSDYLDPPFGTSPPRSGGSPRRYQRRWSKSPFRLGAPEPTAGSGSARPHLPWTGIEGCRGTGLRPPAIHGAPIGPHHRLSRRLVRRPGRSTFREGP
jgi:hypothetical protein